MGYLDNQSTTVTAILTQKGRELLSKGRTEFNITQFALADDEIDYDLYNPAHPLGSDYYGTIIENMPITEPVPDESQMMKHKLISLSRKTVRIPVVTVASKNIILSAPGESYKITPNTINFPNANKTLGYTAILSDNDAATLRVAAGKSVPGQSTMPRAIGDMESPQSVAVTGLEFEIVSKAQPLSDKSATVTIIGNETGGRVVVDILVKKLRINTPDNPDENNPNQ
jgi:hypothetical protein